MTTAQRRFRRLGIITVCAVYLLILVGGIVRASGAGMGCPDWPTCFGQWVPPTSVSQLPADYQQIYADLGYRDTEFNVVKTWTEYINRLAGVTIGFLIFLTALASFAYRKEDRLITWLSVMAFFMVGFQGWLGSVVVSSNLQPYIITIHMLMALAIVAVLIFCIGRSLRDRVSFEDLGRLPPRVGVVLWLALAMSLLQIGMGTQVREAVDVIAANYGGLERHLWRDDFPGIFYLHRAFAALVLFVNLWLIWDINTHVHRECGLYSASLLLGGMIGVEILAGVIMDRLGIPAAIQPLHLLLACMIFGVQFFMLTIYRFTVSKPAVAAGGEEATVPASS